ncbi:MAG: type II toxin-antitoxin system RelE/ParE family toxin [Bacteroidetes bacterium]|nr:type II toxin-antitoxin system RelE/ParE family toxin [Bacteroidota bacterium]
MRAYRISIDPEALQDIQDATDWYNEQLKGLGGYFLKQVKSQINSLKKNAVGYAVRYENVRCMQVRRFPFLVHYTVSERQRTVEVFAVFHTSRNPKIWLERKKGE